MKKLITPAMLLIATTFLMGGTAFADCGPNTPPSVQEAILFLSLVERGGISYTAPLDPRGDEIGELCNELQSSSMQPMASKEGYTALTLDLGSRRCSFSMILMADGHSDDMDLIGCSN